MVEYVSTRGGESVGLGQAVLGEMPLSGGLYVPKQVPIFDWPPP